MDKIVGAIILSSALVSGTWLVSSLVHHLTVTKKERLISERLEKQTRLAMAERLAHDALLKMYEGERDLRMTAETKLGIREDQNKRLDREVKRLKGLLTEAERKSK